MDWTPIIVAIIAATPPTLAAIVTSVKVNRTVQEVTSIHMLMNSRMDELLKVARDESHARGVKDEWERREAADEDDSAQGEI